MAAYIPAEFARITRHTGHDTLFRVENDLDPERSLEEPVTQPQVSQIWQLADEQHASRSSGSSREIEPVHQDNPQCSQVDTALIHPKTGVGRYVEFTQSVRVLWHFGLLGLNFDAHVLTVRRDKITRIFWGFSGGYDREFWGDLPKKKVYVRGEIWGMKRQDGGTPPPLPAWKYPAGQWMRTYHLATKLRDVRVCIDELSASATPRLDIRHLT